MSSVPAVSVVVPTRDRSNRLQLLLESLRSQTLGAESLEVVVVDNGSVDGTPALIRREQQRGGLRLVGLHRSRGQGPGPARNDGWRAASAPLVAFTDDDCEAAPDWLERGLAAGRARPAVFVQGQTRPQPRELGRLGPFARTQAVASLGPFYQTCNMFYPRALLERLGGFDEAYDQLGGEDTDLAWRAIESGAEPVFAEDALVFHAVEDLGPVGQLRIALRWSDAMQVFGTHRGLRDAVLQKGVFWKLSHELLLRALAGAVLSRRFKPAALLAIPYCRHLVERCRQTDSTVSLAPYFAVHDVAETYAAARGALRHRVLVI